MFTGIVEEVGHVAAVENLGGGRRLSISAKMVPELRPEQSVAVNGACLTVVRTQNEVFDVVVVEESLRKTTLGNLGTGDPLNLERALAPTGRLDGHIVLGHVDATGTITAVTPEQTSTLYRIRFEAAYAPYVIPVGSVAIDGISLTVARLDESELTVAIIPYTREHTIVSTWKTGKKVNLEFDLIGKYVARWLSTWQGGAPTPPQIDEAWLREKGF